MQRHIVAILHLNCEPKQARLFRSARTGKQAWDILASRFASNSAPNVMRLEESFGTARQGDDQFIMVCGMKSKRVFSLMPRPRLLTRRASLRSKK